MTQFLANLYAIFATMPFVSFTLIYFIFMYRTKNKMESLKWAIHISMFFLMSAVSVMMNTVTGSTAGFWWIILILIAVGGLLVWLQWKIRQRILLGRVLRTIWYLGFLVFTLSYIILFISGIVVHYQRT